MVNTVGLDPTILRVRISPWIHLGEMAEWSNATVLKTARCNSLVGPNPTLSAKGELLELGNRPVC